MKDNVSFFFSGRGRHTGLAQVDGWGSVSEQGQTRWENSPDHRSQHWHRQGDGPGHGQARYDPHLLFVSLLLLLLLDFVQHFPPYL